MGVTPTHGQVNFLVRVGPLKLTGLDAHGGGQRPLA
jgi:hypothetical protein